MVGLALAAIIVSALAAILVTTTGLKDYRETLRTGSAISTQQQVQ